MAGLNVKRAALRGEWEAITKLYRDQPTLANDAPVTITGDTLLHVSAQSSRTDIVKELLELLSEHVRRATNGEGNTVLHEAARTGMVEMAELIVGKDEVLMSSRNERGETPLYWAAMYGRKEMFLFLSFSGRGSTMGLRRNDGSTILHAAVVGGFYDLALEIVEQYPCLAWSRDDKGITPLHLLALSPSSFKSGTIYSYQYVGASAYFSPEKLAMGVYACIPIEAYETSIVAAERPWQTRKFMERCKNQFRSGIKWISLGSPVLRIIYSAKEKHTYALQLTKNLLEKDSQWSYRSDGRDPCKCNRLRNNHVESGRKTTKIIERPLILATKMGIVEMVREIVKIFPESLEFLDDEAGKNVLHLAAQHRHEYVLELLKSMKRDFANLVVGIDREGNSVLHAAAKLGADKPWHIRGPAHRLQWECVWFERVKNLLPAHIISNKNTSNQTAREVFTETHKDLVQKGEKWLKDVSNSCMLMSTLIATVMFASAFTVPGGNDEKTGLPVLLNTSDFTPFIQYVAVSLFFSLVSLGLFLSLCTSRYNEEDFFAWLPIMTVVAFTSLFNSIVYTIAAFCQAYFLVTGWRFPLVVTTIDITCAGIGFFFFVYFYLDMTLCIIRYLVDILFI